MSIAYMGIVFADEPGRKSKNEWVIIVEPTRIILRDKYRGIYINLDVVSNLTYSNFRPPYLGDNGLERQGNFRTNQFRLQITTQEGTSDFGRVPEPKGSIAVLTTQMTIEYSIPHNVAKRFLEIGNGTAE